MIGWVLVGDYALGMAENGVWAAYVVLWEDVC